MIDLQNMNIKPTIEEIDDYIDNPLFNQFYQYMNKKYKALCKIEYSKDVFAHGWNIKLRKVGKGLCVIYPKKNYFTVLVVIGRKEKETVDQLLPHLSKETQKIYHETTEGNGQRWLMIDLNVDNDIYQDTLKLIHIRRESK